MERHPAADAARHDAIRRVFDLPWRDILEVYVTIGSYVEVGGTHETKLSKQLRGRAEALEALEAAADHLGLADGAPLRVEEFDAAARQLGLNLNSAKVIRRWETWRVAVDALWGRSIPETPQQRALRRATSGKRRSAEDRLTGMRDWLKTKPASRRTEDYDLYVQRRNEERPEEPTLTKSPAILIALLLDWDLLTKVADYELEIDEARAMQEARTREHEGKLALVGLREAAVPLGLSRGRTQELANTPDFPAHVAIISGARAWRRSDVAAYAAKRPFPRRAVGELQDRLMDAVAVRETVHLRPAVFTTEVNKRLWNLVPKPAGRVARRWYWLRADVEEWVKGHPDVIQRRTAKGASKRS